MMQSEAVKMSPDFELIDTHAHLYAPEFDEDRAAMVERAIEQGVRRIMLPNIDGSSIDRMIEMENDYPEVCYAMIGLHPCSVDMDFRKALDEIEAWLDHRSFRGIGEVGTDLYWDKTYVEQQITCFNHQIDLAKSRQLPLVIHSRESLDMNIDLVAQKQDGSLRGVFHCFTGHREQAQRIIDLGFYMGIGGVVTFKNSGLGQIVRDLPMEAILLETDAPYLAPHPYRGKRNESAYIALIAQKVAECKEMELSAVAEITTANAKRLFRLN